MEDYERLTTRLFYSWLLIVGLANAKLNLNDVLDQIGVHFELCKYNFIQMLTQKLIRVSNIKLE